MIFRYADIGRKFTESELNKQFIIDVEIEEFLDKLKPTTKNVFFNKQEIGKVRDTLIEIYIKDLNLCNERYFYP